MRAFGSSATKASLAPSDETLQAELKHARAQLLAAAGPGALVDAAAVAGTFNMITRIVDASGHASSATQRRVMGTVASVVDARYTIGALLIGAGAVLLALARLTT